MDKSTILDKPVAILGGGACAQTFAAEFTLAGYRVRLYELPELAQATLPEVLRTHEIELGGTQTNFKWFKRTGVARVDVVTTDISEALGGGWSGNSSHPGKGPPAFLRKNDSLLRGRAGDKHLSRQFWFTDAQEDDAG